MIVQGDRVNNVLEKLFVVGLLTASACQPDIYKPESFSDVDQAPNDDGDAQDDADPAEGMFVRVINQTGADLGELLVCADEYQIDCQDLPPLLEGDYLEVPLTLDLDDVLFALGGDPRVGQWYRDDIDLLVEPPEDGHVYDLVLEELGCGLYEGDRFHVTLHQMVIHPVKASNKTWDDDAHVPPWIGDLASAITVGGIAIGAAAAGTPLPPGTPLGLAGDIASTLVDGLGNEIANYINSQSSPDAAYHAGLYYDTDPASWLEAHDIDALATFHRYKRSEGESPSVENTILPVYDDEMIVLVSPGMRLVFNVFDVDFEWDPLNIVDFTQNEERIGGIRLSNEDLRSMADCGPLLGVPGIDSVIGASMDVRSYPDL